MAEKRNEDVEKDLEDIKASGVFDSLRHQMAKEIEDKASLKVIARNMDETTTKFLSKQKWTSEMKKNDMREAVAKHVKDAVFLDLAVGKIVEQVMSQHMDSLIRPKIKEYFDNRANEGKQADFNMDAIMAKINLKDLIDVKDLGNGGEEMLKSPHCSSHATSVALPKNHKMENKEINVEDRKAKEKEKDKMAATAAVEENFNLKSSNLTASEEDAYSLPDEDASLPDVPDEDSFPLPDDIALLLPGDDSVSPSHKIFTEISSTDDEEDSEEEVDTEKENVDNDVEMTSANVQKEKDADLLGVGSYYLLDAGSVSSSDLKYTKLSSTDDEEETREQPEIDNEKIDNVDLDLMNMKQEQEEDLPDEGAYYLPDLTLLLPDDASVSSSEIQYTKLSSTDDSDEIKEEIDIDKENIDDVEMALISMKTENEEYATDEGAYYLSDINLLLPDDGSVSPSATKYTELASTDNGEEIKDDLDTDKEKIDNDVEMSMINMTQGKAEDVAEEDYYSLPDDNASLLSDDGSESPLDTQYKELSSTDDEEDSEDEVDTDEEKIDNDVEMTLINIMEEKEEDDNDNNLEKTKADQVLTDIASDESDEENSKKVDKPGKQQATRAEMMAETKEHVDDNDKDAYIKSHDGEPDKTSAVKEIEDWIEEFIDQILNSILGTEEKNKTNEQQGLSKDGPLLKPVDDKESLEKTGGEVDAKGQKKAIDDKEDRNESERIEVAKMVVDELAKQHAESDNDSDKENACKESKGNNADVDDPFANEKDPDCEDSGEEKDSFTSAQ